MSFQNDGQSKRTKQVPYCSKALLRAMARSGALWLILWFSIRPRNFVCEKIHRPCVRPSPIHVTKCEMSRIIPVPLFSFSPCYPVPLFPLFPFFPSIPCSFSSFRPSVLCVYFVPLSPCFLCSFCFPCPSVPSVLMFLLFPRSLLPLFPLFPCSPFSPIPLVSRCPLFPSFPPFSCSSCSSCSPVSLLRLVLLLPLFSIYPCFPFSPFSPCSFCSPSSETQGQLVRSVEKARRTFSCTGERAPGYRLSPNYFQKFKRMTAPDWAQKILCIIVPNRRIVSPEFFS